MANKQPKTKKSKAKKDSKKRSSRRNKTQEGGSQELINAVMRNDIDSVYNFLNTPGVDVNYTNNNGITPLIFASWRGYLNIVRLLLDYGAIVQTPNFNVNVLNEAAKSGHIDVVNELLDRGAHPEWPDWVDMFGMSIVERVKNNPEMVDLLIRKGIPRYTRQHAERDGVLAQYDQIYLEFRALSTVVRDTTNLPLNFGNREGPIGSYFGRFRRFGGKRKTKKSKAKKGSKKRVSRRNKIQEGGDNETEDDMLAKINKIYDDEKGDMNDLNQVDKSGKTLLHRASEKGFITVVEELIQYAIVELNIQDKKGKTALHYASENGHWQVVKELLTDSKIDVNVQDIKGKTPLHYAYDETVVRDLLRNGGSLTIKDNDGKTPVDYKKERDTIRRLLTPGSSINAPSHEGKALVHSLNEKK